METKRRNYAKLLEHGNKAQLEKLKKNDHKSDFLEIELTHLFTMLFQEYCELEEEFINRNMEEWRENIDYNKIRHEAADIANFAHMIILKCDKEINGK